MTRSVFEVPDVMRKIAVIRPSEEGRYSDIRHWSGEIETWTDDAVLLWLDDVVVQRPAKDRWMPLSQLRKAEDNQSVYASFWILDKKGL